MTRYGDEAIQGPHVLALDCFAEPVIGPAKGRTRWLAMTALHDSTYWTVKGSDFWRASIDGAAGSFSRSVGRRVLAAKLRQLLPGLDVE